MSEFQYKDTSLYETGVRYKEWGEMLMDPKTTIHDLVAFGLKYDAEIQMRVVGLTEALSEPLAAPETCSPECLGCESGDPAVQGCHSSTPG